MFALPAGIIEGQDVNCGYLTVPASHDAPDGPTLELAVAIFEHRSVITHPEPLFLLQGGPGGSTLFTFPSLIQDSELLHYHDIVLLEQRGTMYSSPSLDCEETQKFVVDHLNTDLPTEQLEAEWNEALSECRVRLVSMGIDLSDFDSFENARDIEDLRLALGYGQIDLYGVSYGSLLALHYLDLFPDSLHAVILDGVVPPQHNYIRTNVLDQDRVFTTLFSACAGSPECSRSYPDLEQVFFELVAELEKAPVSVILHDQEAGQDYDALIDGETFYSGIYQILYSAEFIPAIPYIVYQARSGEFEGFTTLLGLMTFQKGMSYGMYYSVNCSEKADDPRVELDLNAVRPEIVELNEGDYESFLDSCIEWPVEALGPQADEAVRSDVPVLLLSGGYDPVTPESNALTAARSLNNSYAYTIPSGGHGQAFTNPCADSIILEFLGDPANAPETGCIAEYSEVGFWRKGDLIPVPLFGRGLMLDQDLLWPAVFLIVAALGAASALFVLPLVWLIKMVRSGRKRDESANEVPGSSNPEEQSVLAGLLRTEVLLQFASPAAILNGLIVPAFWAALTTVFIYMLVQEDMMVVWGAPAALRALFVLPLLSLFLTVFMTWATVAGWRSTNWSIWRKVYYTGLTLSAAACSVAALHLGVVFQLFK